MKSTDSDFVLLKQFYEWIESHGYQPTLVNFAKHVGQRGPKVQAAFKRLEEDGFLGHNGDGGAFLLHHVVVKIFHESHREAVEEFFRSLP